MKRALFTAAVGIAAAAVGIGPATASAPVVAIYNASVSPTPPSQVSEAFEATSTSEFGDQVQFAGSARTLNAITVTMVSWACKEGSVTAKDCYTPAKSTFSVPITVNVYDAGQQQGDGTVTPGDLLLRATKSFAIPYRPTASLKQCRGDALGEWYSTADSSCHNGKASKITWNFGSLGVTLPDTAIVTVAYNTSHYGAHPIGTAACSGTEEGCPYDSLNVGLTEDSAPSVGSETYPGTVYQNTSWDGALCQDGGSVTGKLNLDAPNNACWDGYLPAIKVTAH